MANLGMFFKTLGTKIATLWKTTTWFKIASIGGAVVIATSAVVIPNAIISETGGFFHKCDFSVESIDTQYSYSEANCTEKAKYYYSCACGEKGTELFEYGNALGHDLTHYASKQVTCTEIGYDEYDTCSRCDYTTYNEISATGHTNGDWITDANATCTEDGSKHQVCSVCNDTIRTETLSKLGHTDGEWVTDKEANCTEDGSKHQVCSVCEETIKTEVIVATGHILGEWTIEKEATCTENGQEAKHCIVCNEKLYTKTISAKHSYSIVQDLPTCQSNGSTTIACTNCTISTTKEWTPITFEIDRGNYYLNQGITMLYYLEFTVKNISGGCISYDSLGNQITNNYTVRIYNSFYQEYSDYSNIKALTGAATKRFYGGTDVFNNSVFQISISDGFSTYVYYVGAHSYTPSLIDIPFEHHTWDTTVCGNMATCQACANTQYVSHSVLSGACPNCKKTVYMPEIVLPEPAYLSGGGKIQSISCVAEPYTANDLYVTLTFTIEYLKNGTGFVPGFKYQIYDNNGLLSSRSCIMEETDIVDGIYVKTFSISVLKSSSYQIKIIPLFS